MATEHHIDAFDPLSFFNLHDLNRDNILDHAELEAIYGVHHETRKGHVEDEAQLQAKNDEILKAVLEVSSPASLNEVGLVRLTLL